MSRPAPPRVLTVVIQERGMNAADAREAAEEINELAEAAAMDALLTRTVKLRLPRPATFISATAVADLAQMTRDYELQQVIIDRDLSVTQTRNLEREIQLPVIDRSELILNIFSRRAVTHEGKLQVELARCRRQIGRLAGLWTHLERQRGGIGLRGGPGEKQMELDRRRLNEKIKRLEKKLQDMMRRQTAAQKRRRKNRIVTATLVGYTNAGKSSLFNLLTGETASAKNRLFDTLDATARRIHPPDGEPLIVSDTVGFIRNLPHELIAGFHATLQGTANSDILMIVTDGARPDWEQRLDLVEKQLAAIGAGDKKKILVINKIDLPGGDLPRRPGVTTVRLSCKTGEGLPLLQKTLAEMQI